MTKLDFMPGKKTIIVALLYIILKWSEKLLGLDVPEEMYQTLLGAGVITTKMGLERK